MSTSYTPEQIQGLANAVSVWRMSEYTAISFYALYVYYILTTMDEEVSVIAPLKWNLGKILYMIIRYGTLGYIALQLSRDYRTYLTITLASCKAMYVIYQVLRWAVSLASNFSLGLCLSALLQAKILGLAVIMSLCMGLPFASAILGIVGYIQYPAEPVSRLDRELGYPCYVPDVEGWTGKTVIYLGRDVRAYVSLVTTTLLAVIGVAALVVRYKGQRGPLVRVIRRDGALHHLSLLAIRLVSAIVYTPALSKISPPDENPGYLLFYMASDVVIPILAQRLLINMRKVDYESSRPVASTLLFSPSLLDSDNEDKDEATIGGDLNTMGTLGSESTRHRDEAEVASA